MSIYLMEALESFMVYAVRFLPLTVLVSARKHQRSPVALAEMSPMCSSMVSGFAIVVGVDTCGVGGDGAGGIAAGAGGAVGDVIGCGDSGSRDTLPALRCILMRTS